MPLAPLARLAAALGLGATLYAALPQAANAGSWGAEDRAALAALATGHMEKLVVHETAKPALEAAFEDGTGEAVALAEFRGRVVLLNFWATWCPPCRAEMPALDRLAGAMEGEDFAVVTLSNDFGGAAKPKMFFEETGIEHLALYVDPTRQIARKAGILGLPVTLLLDRKGREVARLVGDAEWDSAEAKAAIAALIERSAAAR